MTAIEQIQAHRDQVERIVREQGASNPRVFGPAVDNEPNDDGEMEVDIVVDFPTEEVSMLTLSSIEDALSDATGMNVKVFTPESIKEEYREEFLADAVPV